jgi:hypothetical protein
MSIKPARFAGKNSSLPRLHAEAEGSRFMSHTKQVLIRVSQVSVVLVFATAVLIVLNNTKGQESNARSSAANDEWEYLAVAGPSSTNFTPTNNPKMRKEPNAGFAREAFVLEQHLDKLGANGWELVSVAGPPTDPAYYFKRRK